MPKISFSDTIPLEKPIPQYCCTDCIHKHHINKDLFECTILGTYHFNKESYNSLCLKKATSLNRSAICIGAFAIKDDGTFEFTGVYTVGILKTPSTDHNCISGVYKEFEAKIKEIGKPVRFLLIAEKRYNLWTTITNKVNIETASEIIKELNANNL